MTTDTLATILMVVLAMILSGTVHEWAHAWTATRLGDDTPERDGRVTLDPMAHIDPIGTIAVPALLTALGGFFFGWARPVAFRLVRFKRTITQRKGTLLVALAGPVSNLVLAFLCALLIGAVLVVSGTPTPATDSWAGVFLAVLGVMVALNVILFLFNLVPIPPLDGSWILQSILGPSHALVRFTERHRWMLFIALILLAGTLLARPMYWLTHGMHQITATLFGLQ